MIIYGTRAAHLGTKELPNIVCRDCETQGSIRLSLFRRHAHVFWIPLFPLNKFGISECQHCKSTLRHKEMPEALSREYDNLKMETKGPLWQFSGLFLMAILIVWISFTSGKNKELEVQQINNPEVGDVYSYEIETGRYSTFKVAEITNDSIFLYPNDYEINKVTRVYKIDKENNYSDSAIGFTRQEVVNLYNSGTIYDVDR
jgi:hypothetical protein